MGGLGDSHSSSIDSNPSLISSASSSSQPPERDLSTDLRLGLSISQITRRHDSSFSPTRDHSDWPPIKPLLRSTLADEGNHQQQPATFFVKVYIEGIPIGRKLDLFAHYGYDDLIRTLRRMFRTTTILCPEHRPQVSSKKTHVLTYEDKEGDWMMVGDVPWELFLNTVKRLKITRADKC